MSTTTANMMQMILIEAHASIHQIDIETAAVEWIGKHAAQFREMIDYCIR